MTLSLISLALLFLAVWMLPADMSDAEPAESDPQTYSETMMEEEGDDDLENWEDSLSQSDLPEPDP